MKKINKGLALLSIGLVLGGTAVDLSNVLATIPAVHAEEAVTAKDLVIDGDAVDPYNRFKGFGTVSCNNTSRLLLDYKEEHPDKYWEIMNQLFNPETGAGLTHVKIELGADVNSSSGTEPATKRYIDEPANVRRGAGYIFADDAKSINPNITTEILRWGEPRFSWTPQGNKESNPHANKYQWYKQTIDAVKKEFGWTIDYVGLSQNERAQNNGKNEDTWLIYYLENIVNEPNYETDYKKIKYVAADGYRDTKTIANLMLANKTVREGISVVSTHYGLSGSSELDKLQDQLIAEGKKPKEVWVSEGIAPMINARQRQNMQPDYQGVGGQAGIMDVVSRIISVYSWTGTANQQNAVSFDFQPAVASFYEGSSYSPKHLISAMDPWSGFYEVDGGLQAVRQIMNFVGQDDPKTAENERWQYITSACYSDGSFNDGGVTVDSSSHNYLTLKDEQTNDYTSFFVNNTKKTRKYNVTAKNLGTKATAKLQVWETKGTDNTVNYDENWMQYQGDIQPNADGTYSVTVAPYSALTVTTLQKDVKKTEYKSAPVDISQDTVMTLPYEDDFEYAEYPVDEEGRDYVERRGGTPRYTTDQNAAFEVVKNATIATDPLSYQSRKDRSIPDEAEHGNLLQQMITTDTLGAGWGVWGGKDGGNSGAGAQTNLGDHRWTNYKASIDFLLNTDVKQVEQYKNFALLGIRQLKSGGDDTQATYAAKIYKDGTYEILNLRKVVKTGTIADFDVKKWHNLALTGAENVITLEVDGKVIDTYVDTDKNAMNGRINLGSGNYETLYDNLKIEPVEGLGYYADMVDSADGRKFASEDAAKANADLGQNNFLNYFGNFDYSQTGYANHNRTMMTSQSGNAVWSGTTVGFKDTTTTANTVGKVFYEGQVENTANYAKVAAGGSYAVTFKGKDIKLTYTRATDLGKADVYVDGVKVDTIDFINNYELPGQTWEMKGLEEKEHTVKVVAVEGAISFEKGEFSDSALNLQATTKAPTDIVKINADEQVTTAENTVFAYRNPNAWGTQSSNAWANFNDNPYILVNFTGTGIDWKGNTGSTAYKFELDGKDVGNFGPTNGTVYSIRDLENGKHTLKVSLGDNEKKDTYMDYRGVTIYGLPQENVEVAGGFYLNFEGSGFNLFGNTSAAAVKVTIDNKVYTDRGLIQGKGDRQTSFCVGGLKEGKHTAKVEVIGGKLAIDGVNILKGKSNSTGTSVDPIEPVLDFKALNEAIAKAEVIEQDKYTEDSYALLQEKLVAGRTVVEKGEHATQTEIDQATADLVAAFNGLEEKPTVDKADLQALITQVEALVAADYTPETWSALAEKLAAAKTVLTDEAATQVTVDTATADLQAAKDALVKAENVVEADSISLDVTGVKTLKVKKTLQLNATVAPAETTNKTVTYEIANKAIANIDENGLITGVKAGTTKVTATTVNGKKATFTLRVTR